MTKQKVGRPRHRYEAWIVGEHALPNSRAPRWFRADPGTVLVHNLTAGWWRVLSLRAFKRQFEWGAK